MIVLIIVGLQGGIVLIIVGLQGGIAINVSITISLVIFFVHRVILRAVHEMMTRSKHPLGIGE